MRYDTIFVPTCSELGARRIRAAIEGSIARCVEHEMAGIDKQYQAVCSATASINDRLIVKYPLHYYHFTLYYYDRAGNIIKPVPPDGVDLSTTDRNTHPDHKQITQWLKRAQADP